MKIVDFKMEFSSGNDAFMEDPRGATIDILIDVMAKLEIENKEGGPLRDANGNSVGSWYLSVTGEGDDDADSDED